MLCTTGWLSNQGLLSLQKTDNQWQKSSLFQGVGRWDYFRFVLHANLGCCGSKVFLLSVLLHPPHPALSLGMSTRSLRTQVMNGPLRTFYCRHSWSLGSFVVIQQWTLSELLYAVQVALYI